MRGLPSRSSRTTPAFAQMGFGVAASTRFASEGLPSRSSRTTPAFAQMGFGVAAFTRFASEGWWACLDSNQEPDRYERPALTIELQARAASRRHTRGAAPPYNAGWQGAIPLSASCSVVGWAKARLRAVPTMLAQRVDLMVGTPSDAFASAGFAHPT